MHAYGWETVGIAQDISDKRRGGCSYSPGWDGTLAGHPVLSRLLVYRTVPSDQHIVQSSINIDSTIRKSYSLVFTLYQGLFEGT